MTEGGFAGQPFIYNVLEVFRLRKFGEGYIAAQLIAWAHNVLYDQYCGTPHGIEKTSGGVWEGCTDKSISGKTMLSLRW